MNRQIFHLLLALIAAGMAIQSPTLAQEANLCRDVGATDLQAQFPRYQVAVCIQGMNPTHMVVQLDSNPLKVMKLEWINPNATGEDSRTIKPLQNGGWFYQAKDGGKTYKLLVKKGRVAELEIQAAGNTEKLPHEPFVLLKQGHPSRVNGCLMAGDRCLFLPDRFEKVREYRVASGSRIVHCENSHE